MIVIDYIRQVRFCEWMKYLVDNKDILKRNKILDLKQRKYNEYHTICSYYFAYKQLLSRNIGEKCGMVIFDSDEDNQCFDAWLLDVEEGEYPIAGEDWSKVLGYEVDPNVIIDGKKVVLSNAAIVGEIIWGLTFCGFDGISNCVEEDNNHKEKCDKMYREILESNEGRTVVRELYNVIGIVD